MTLHFFCMTHLILNITVYVFQYGVGAYFWAAILEFKVRMVQNIVKSFYYISITFMMPELSRNSTSFAFLSSLYQEMSFFLVFNMASAAILGCHLEFESQDRPKIRGPKYNEYHYIRSAKPALVENDTSEVLIIHLAQEKSLLMFLNMVSETTTGRPSWIWMSRWFQNTIKIFPLDLECQT